MATNPEAEAQDIRTNPAPPKFSRYRSVRNAAKQPPPTSPPSLPQTVFPTQNASIARSMSRYRHAKPPNKTVASPPSRVPGVPPIPALKPTSPPVNGMNGAPAVPPHGPAGVRSDSIPKQRKLQDVPQPGSNSSGMASRPRTTQTHPRHDGINGGRTREYRERDSQRKQRAGGNPYDRSRREARDILSAEDQRLRRLKTQQEAIKEAEKERKRQKAEAETRQREMEEMEAQEKQRAELEAIESAKREKLLEEERLANKKAAVRIAALEAKKAARMERKERFAFLSRDAGDDTDPSTRRAAKGNDSLKRIISAPQAMEAPKFIPPPKTSSLPVVNEVSKIVDAPISVRSPKRNDSPKDVESPKFIAPGGGGIVPGTDAPISAVNAEGRKVLVKCNESSITLPITPETTPSDLIFSAANCLSETFDPKHSILLESFTQLGLERPLRKYEHIRDVLNSWDNDAQNTLLIIPAPENGSEDDLDVKNAPREQPGDTSVLLYHSMKPGHWDKRWVTLRSDGQVLVAKKADGDKSNICHLSDFDIYAPTPRRLAKHIKPPKKICFAVKSQQKSSMFLSGANFVHFFATSDKKLAASWYKAIQEWRSWYLVNVMGEGQKKSKKANGAPQLDGLAFLSSPDSLQEQGHQRSISVDSTPYQLGSFTPLLDLDSIGPLSNSLPQRSNSVAKADNGRHASTRENRYPPTSFPNNLSKDTSSHGRAPSLVQGASPQEIDQATFAPSGLLGRTYSQRQKAQRGEEGSKGPFLPGLLNGTNEPDHGRNNSIRSVNRPSTTLARSSSQRQKPKPLIDLTPVYQEPPQHARKGRGVAAEPGKQLVDVATGPEILPGAIVVPPATAWRRPQTQAGGVPQDNGIFRSGSRRGPTGGRRASIDAARPSLDETSPFTGTGLLASRSKESRPIGTGRGVATGDRNARAPMIDVTERSHFQEGSLLRSVEMHTGGGGPAIDREKRIEGEVRVGEGF